MAVEELNELDGLSRLNVLIIDDNPMVHFILQSSLKEMGIRNVRSSESAFRGLRLCAQFHFHIVICAFNVDQDKDGFHLLEELKFKGHVNKRTVVIFLSSETSEALVNCIIELQPDDFWVKPLSAKTVKTRLRHTIDIKLKLFNVYQAVDNGDHSKAIYYAERHLLNPELKKYHLNLLRMKGDALISLREYQEAERFFKELLDQCKYPWVYVGYVRSLLKQDKLEAIADLLQRLTHLPETRFATYEMLAEYHIEAENYERAYEEIKNATALAPRNIERNKKSWDLARLNHDHAGQFVAAKNMHKNAVNSIHDSPELLLNVIRAGIDLAAAQTDGSSHELLRETERHLAKLERNYQDIEDLKEQIIVARARLHNARSEDNKARSLVENHVSLKPTLSVEDNLDKVKVFHELSMREESSGLLTAVKRQIAGDTLTSQVLGKYVQQEAQEREEIHYTPKELNQMAVEYFKRNRLLPAANALEQALQLAPKNHKLAISLLKVLIKIRTSDQHTADQVSLAETTIERLDTQALPEEDQQAYSELRRIWQEMPD